MSGPHRGGRLQFECVHVVDCELGGRFEFEFVAEFVLIVVVIDPKNQKLMMLVEWMSADAAALVLEPPCFSRNFQKIDVQQRLPISWTLVVWSGRHIVSTKEYNEL